MSQAEITIQEITIQGRRIGAGAPVYIIAELSANHGQDFDQALAIIQAAKEAGADAVKLQTYTPDTLTLDSEEKYFRVGGGTLWDGRTLYDLYKEAYTPWAWQPKLKAAAEDLGLALFSSPFDFSAVDFLETMQVPAYKIASFELVDLPLIRYAASTGRPVILSTGMASFSEIEEAIEAVYAAGGTQVALLHCSSAYPAPPEAMHLRTIPDMAERFGVPIGLSDHTLSLSVPVAAVALGACLLEKHLTLSRAVPGPDSAFSLEPKEFQEMVQAVRTAEKALGTAHYGTSASEEKSRIFRRSLFVVQDIRAGETFTKENIRSIRPGHGLPPKYLPEILGHRAVQDLKRGTPLASSHWAAPEE